MYDFDFWIRFPLAFSFSEKYLFGEETDERETDFFKIGQ